MWLIYARMKGDIKKEQIGILVGESFGTRNEETNEKLPPMWLKVMIVEIVGKERGR